MVGHVDFKFLLNSNITNIPQIQVTLLKNKAPGLAKVNGKIALLFFFFLNIKMLGERRKIFYYENSLCRVCVFIKTFLCVIH